MTPLSARCPGAVTRDARDVPGDPAFVGMVQHQDTRTTTRIHALSRTLVYQAVME